MIVELERFRDVFLWVRRKYMGVYWEIYNECCRIGGI